MELVPLYHMVGNIKGDMGDCAEYPAWSFIFHNLRNPITDMAINTYSSIKKAGVKKEWN